MQCCPTTGTTRTDGHSRAGGCYGVYLDFIFSNQCEAHREAHRQRLFHAGTSAIIDKRACAPVGMRHPPMHLKMLIYPFSVHNN